MRFSGQKMGKLQRTVLEMFRPPATLPRSVFQNHRAAHQAIALADIDFTPMQQGSNRFRAVKNRETTGRPCLGKSLMITTLKEIFNGRKDLFEGLAIAKTDYEWKKHPVLHFNFGQCANATGYENLALASGNSVHRAFGRHTKTHRVAESLRD